MQGLLVTLFAAFLIVLLFLARRHRSAFFSYFYPPLKIDPNDELLALAVSRAKTERARLEELFAQRPRDTYVRLSGESGAAAPEWLRLVALDGAQVRVSPAEGDGTERSASFERLEDWQVELPDGNIRGGFTIEVQMLRAAQQYGGLPQSLAAQQKRYLDHAWNAAEDAEGQEGGEGDGDA